MSDDLIAGLSADLEPVRPEAMRNRLLLGLGAGVLAAALLMLVWLGLRPDLAEAVATPIFWLKFAFATALTGAGFAAAIRLARPGGSLRMPLRWTTAIVAVTAVAGLVQLLMASPDDVRALILGGSALVCPVYIVALSLPVLAANVVVMRRLAPTNLTGAGFAAGLLAGAAGTWVYAFHCTESGLPFITHWYTPGTLATALVGAAVGRWLLLRW